MAGKQKTRNATSNFFWNWLRGRARCPVCQGSGQWVRGDMVQSVPCVTCDARGWVKKR
jgi:DnaJ-class molecular chaperone